ncbi:hypothetical protein [Ferrimonas marina]|uniref:Uncharacterized protein n=1 Tax=Ferrimonas marina TaxID=299255 RepID=A0A1M5UH06_9GAMM|nr:hypothetical protein [Ferrimonas marina]SHH62210.1 hypothetical protein SAMN02745129_2566 [Ferrimonas marina]
MTEDNRPEDPAKLDIQAIYRHVTLMHSLKRDLIYINHADKGEYRAYVTAMQHSSGKKRPDEHIERVKDSVKAMYEHIMAKDQYFEVIENIGSGLDRSYQQQARREHAVEKHSYYMLRAQEQLVRSVELLDKAIEASAAKSVSFQRAAVWDGMRKTFDLVNVGLDQAKVSYYGLHRSATTLVALSEIYPKLTWHQPLLDCAKAIVEMDRFSPLDTVSIDHLNHRIEAFREAAGRHYKLDKNHDESLSL